MLEKELRISVHERLDTQGFVVKIALIEGDAMMREAKFPTDTFAEAETLTASLQKLAGIPGGVNAMFPEEGDPS